MLILDFIAAISKYPNTCKKLVLYFRNVTKNDKFNIPDLAKQPLPIIIPHLVKFCELQGIDFLDALIYASYHTERLDFAHLKEKTIILCFHRLEANRPFNFDLF